MAAAVAGHKPLQSVTSSLRYPAGDRGDLADGQRLAHTHALSLEARDHVLQPAEGRTRGHSVRTLDLEEAGLPALRQLRPHDEVDGTPLAVGALDGHTLALTETGSQSGDVVPGLVRELTVAVEAGLLRDRLPLQVRDRERFR